MDDGKLTKRALEGSLELMRDQGTEVTQDQIALIKSTVAKGATDQELKLFFYDCKRRGVHPLDKLVHFTVRKNKYGDRTYTPVTSIDFMRSQAADSGEYAGNDDPIFLGEIEDGSLAATVTVYRMVQAQRCPFTATARWSEYKPSDDFMWRKMPFTMLGKCAEGLALRKAFPRQLAGLYAKEEMDQSGKAEVLENIQSDEAKADDREAEAMKKIAGATMEREAKQKAKPAMTKAADIIASTVESFGKCIECEGENGAHKWGCKNLKKPGAIKANPADAPISRWENIDLQKARKESDIPDEDYRAVLANNGCPTMHGPDIKMRDFPAILKEIQNYRREPNDPR